jgi:UDP-N-acetylglucosamine diphosphorylase/glucosamine-1-phosphate N-acetyltransferase
MKTHLIALCDLDESGRFGPLTELRQPQSLRCGAFSVHDKLIKRLTLKGYIEDPNPHPADDSINSTLAIRAQDVTGRLFLDNCAILTDTALSQIFEAGYETRFVSESGQLLAIKTAQEHWWEGYLTKDQIAKLVQSCSNEIRLEARRIDYPWQVLEANGAEIESDMEMTDGDFDGIYTRVPTDVIGRGVENLRIGEGVVFGPGVILDADRHQIRIEERCLIEAGVILNARNGSIWIGANTEIRAGAVISGPVYIGENSIVRPGSRLNGNVSLGQECRVGGELSDVIMQGFSNKQHSGYLGNAYLGEWVNLGAATDNSDLKNNYRPINVTFNGELIETGSLHIGVFIGDFVKTAIQTRLNSGTAVGSCCNLFGPDFPDKSLPPFVWFGSEGYEEYRLDKALETIQVVMSRRGRILTETLKNRLTDLFESSRTVRDSFLKQRQDAS